MCDLPFSNFPNLETDRLRLRQIRADDREALFSLRTDARVNQYIDRQPPGSLAEVDDWILKTAERQLLYWVVCLKTTGELIGTACLFNFSTENSTAEIGYELLPDFQKQGLASEAVQAVAAFAFDKLDVKKIEAFINKDNARSVNLIEKLGFSLDPAATKNAPDGFLIFIKCR